MKTLFNYLKTIEDKLSKTNINTILFTIFMCSICFNIIEEIRNPNPKKVMSVEEPKLIVPKPNDAIEDNVEDLSKVRIPEAKVTPQKGEFRNSLTKDEDDKIANFINSYEGLAKEISKDYNIPVSLILAQGILESDFGQSELAKKSNNCFGIKKKNEKLTEKEKSLIVGYVTHMTSEYRNGKKVKEKHYFCKYKTPEDSFLHYAEFIDKRRKSHPSYKHLTKLKSDNWKGWVKAMKATGYSTNDKYSSYLINVIEDYKLYRYD